MKAYGYVLGKDDGLEELQTVSLCFTDYTEAQQFANFAIACAKKMKALAEDYDHEHFNGGAVPDVTIGRLYSSD